MLTLSRIEEPKHPSVPLLERAGSEGRLLAYSSGNLGKALIFSGADLTILFLLTDLLGLSATTAGSLMLIALFGDLVFDLLAARLVIRLRRSGRGYRWMIAAAAVPCGAAFALLYALPALGVRNLWVFACALLLFRGAYAMIDVPHNALMARVTSDSRSRGRVSGYRLFFSTVSGLAIATILTPLVQTAGRDGAFDQLAVTGMIASAIFALTMMLSALTSDSGAERPASTTMGGDGIAIPLRDPMIMGMALLAFITGFAAPTFGRMLLYIGTYVVHRPDLVRTLLLGMTFGQFTGVIVWTAMTGRFSKASLLAVGHAISALGILLFALCLPWPDALTACAVLIGFGFASVFMLPWGLLADAVDFVAWRHNRRFETGLFAFYLVVVKASGAASTALIGWTLGWLGYLPDKAQTASVQVGMLGLGLGIPILGSLGAILLMRNSDIGHACHARLIAALAYRNRRASRHERLDQSDADPVSGLNPGLAKSSGEGTTFAGSAALSAQARLSMSRSIAAPAAVRS